jgi:drug/metabolite transporter (DMT)-like permease
LNKNHVAHFAILLANLIYGINYTFAKDVMPGYIKPFGFIMLRVLGALPLLWLISLLGPREKVSRKDLGRLAICGFFGVAANQLMFFAGLNITTPINAAIIMTTNPILVLIAASFILNQAITKRKILGIAFGIVGASALILFKGNLSLDSSTWTGDLLIFLNSMAYGVYLVLVAPLMSKYRPITVIKWVFAFGALYVIPFGFSQFSEIEWSSFTWEIGLKAAFVVFFTTFIAYLFNVFGLKYLKPSTVSTYIYSQPVFAAVVAIMLGKDQITITKVIAASFIFLGVYLVSKKPRGSDKLSGKSSA